MGSAGDAALAGDILGDLYPLLAHAQLGNCGSPQHLPVCMESPGDENRRHQLGLWAQALVFLPLMSVSRAAAPQCSLLRSCIGCLCCNTSITLLLPSPPPITPIASDCLILPLCLTLSGGKCMDPELCKGIDPTGILPCERQLLLGPCLAALVCPACISSVFP